MVTGPGGAVTVVVMTHNRRAEVCRTLRRLTALPERPPVILVDNGSRDDTLAAVRREFPTRRFPQLDLIASPTNLGAVARNVGVARVRSRYVAFCDDDTWWEPGALSRAAAMLDACPRLAAVTGRILVEPDGREDPITPELRHSPVPAPPGLPGPALVSVLAGASMLRVRAFVEAGGFSARLWLGGEEELLSLDLAARGWWLCFAEQVVVRHAPSTQRDPRRRRQLGIRNTLWTTWLRRPAPAALRRTVALLRVVPRDLATLAALAEALRGLPWVLRERRVLPPAVEASVRSVERDQLRSPARRYVDSAGAAGLTAD